jgi:hypothetical protein
MTREVTFWNAMLALCRMFLDSVVPRQLALRGDGSVCLFEGNFSEVMGSDGDGAG